MAIRGAESTCQAVSTRSFTPSQFLNYVRSDGEVTACERNQLYALAAEFRQRFSGKSADVPRFDSETDAARETAALDEIESLCAESGCDMPEQGAVAGNGRSLNVVTAQASVSGGPLVGYAIAAGAAAICAVIAYVNFYVLPENPKQGQPSARSNISSDLPSW